MRGIPTQSRHICPSGLARRPRRVIYRPWARRIVAGRPLDPVGARRPPPRDPRGAPGGSRRGPRRGVWQGVSFALVRGLVRASCSRALGDRVPRAPKMSPFRSCRSRAPSCSRGRLVRAAAAPQIFSGRRVGIERRVPPWAVWARSRPRLVRARPLFARARSRDPRGSCALVRASRKCHRFRLVRAGPRSRLVRGLVRGRPRGRLVRGAVCPPGGLVRAHPRLAENVNEKRGGPCAGPPLVVSFAPVLGSGATPL